MKWLIIILAVAMFAWVWFASHSRSYYVQCHGTHWGSGGIYQSTHGPQGAIEDAMRSYVGNVEDPVQECVVK